MQRTRQQLRTDEEQGEASPLPEPVQTGTATPVEGLAQWRLTRRELLGGAAALAAGAVVAGCALPFTQQTATKFALGRPATVAFDATVPAALQAPLLSQLKGAVGIPSATAATSAQGADLVVSFGTVPSGFSSAAVGTTPLALVTHMRVPVDEVTHEQAAQLLGGQMTDWKAVGAPSSLAVRLFALGGLALPGGVQVASGAKQVSSLVDLLTALRGQPGSLAAIPMVAADWRVRNLGVDGVYSAQGRGDASKGGMGLLTLRVGAAQSLVQQGLDVKAVAGALAPALASAATLDMVAVGDIMLGRGVNNKMVAYNDYTYPYKGTHDELHSADFRVANLECTITDLVQPPTDPATFTFISAKKAVDGLVYAGFQAVTVANNHAAGPGKAALLDMLQTLRDNKIGVCGGGSNFAEAAAPVVTTIKGRRIALLGFHDERDGENPRYGVPAQGQPATATEWGFAKVDARLPQLHTPPIRRHAELSTLAQSIIDARAKADLVIPYFHWGHEYHEDLWKRQQDVAHAAIDAGADLVLGNHPHVTQGIEEYKGKLIVYSMGNFIFDQDWSVPTLEGMMIHFYWRGTTLASIRFVPTRDRDRCQPVILSQAAAVGVFGRLWQSTDLLAAGDYDTSY